MDNLNVIAVQTDLHWEEPKKNLDMFDGLLPDKQTVCKFNSHLIVLPEMFTTGFSMNPSEYAQTMEGEAVTWMIRKSNSLGCDLTGSVMIRDQETFFNRLIWVKPDGTIYFYNKKHLFRYAGEDKVYSPGSKRVIIDLNGWKICPFICYDLRFPLWIRNIDNQYDVALFVANWPEKRSGHWKSLLAARAIENQSYVIAVNRIGEDGNSIKYQGDSSVIDPTGDILLQKTHEKGLFHMTLNANHLSGYRTEFPVWKDADKDLPEKMSIKTCLERCR